MKKVAIIFVVSCIVLILYFTMSMFDSWDEKSRAKIDMAFTQVLLDGQLSFLRGLSRMLEKKPDMASDVIRDKCIERIDSLLKAKETRAPLARNETHIYFDELSFLNAMWRDWPKTHKEEADVMLKQRIILLRIRLLQCLPLFNHVLTYNETSLPSNAYYVKATEEVASEIQTDEPWERIESEIISDCKEVPLRIATWDGGWAVLYYISEQYPADTFLQDMRSFYTNHGWKPVGYDFCFPAFSNLQHEFWSHDNEGPRVWSEYWVNDDQHLINVNVVYTLKRIGFVTIVHASTPEIITALARNTGMSNSSPVAQTCYLLFQ